MEISQKEMQLEQMRACTELGQRCLKFNPEERPCTQTIIDILEETEREEWCIDLIDPGASSDALRWPTFRSRTLGPKTLTQAITKFYARDTEDMSLEELYRLFTFLTIVSFFLSYFCPVD